MDRIVKRLFSLPLPKGQSAFIWGPRKVGKSFWIAHQYIPEVGKDRCRLIDLLQSDTYAKYATRPAFLREEWQNAITIIDEVQKVPALLDEVHWLIENKGAVFILTGSSARKLRREHANLLAGRAWRYEMAPLVWKEIPDLQLEKALVSGFIPAHYFSQSPEAALRSYVADYLKEEISVEAVVQNLPSFSAFLHVAALTNGELLNYTNVARETGISAKVVRNYFQILEDTLLGFRLPPWRKSRDRRMILTEKFYFFDVGVANYLAKRHPVPGNSDFGKSFEHFILMEILAYKKYRNPELDMYFWRTSAGYEVDFILGDMVVALEVKSSGQVHPAQLQSLRALMSERAVKYAIVVSQESDVRLLDGPISVLPWQVFLKRLWAGDLGV